MKFSPRTPLWVGIVVLSGLAASLGNGTAPAQNIVLPDFRKAPEIAAPCAGCGTVRSIRELTKSRPNPATSSSRSSYRDEVLVGAVFYQPLAKDASSYVGGVGTPEMRARLEMTSYQLTVLMDDGTYQFVEQRDGTRFRTGDRVRIANGRVELL